MRRRWTQSDVFFVSSLRGCSEEAAERRKPAHMGMFSRFSIRGVVGEAPETKNTSSRMFSRFGKRGVVGEVPDMTNTPLRRGLRVWHEGWDVRH